MVKIDLSDETNKRWLHPTGKPVQHNKAKPSKKEEAKEEAENKYNPSQARDDHGRWTDGGGGGGFSSGVSDVAGFKTASQQEKKRLDGIYKDAEKMVNAMKPDDALLEGKLKKIGEDLGLQTKKGPLKKPKRMVEKTFEEEPGFKVTDMKDVVRGTLVMQSLKQKEKVIERIRQDFEIDRVKDLGNITKPGYFDTKVNIKLPNSKMVGEVILMVPEMFNAKAKPTIYKESGHDLYDIERSRASTVAQQEEARAKAEKIYAVAKDRYLKRVDMNGTVQVDL